MMKIVIALAFLACVALSFAEEKVAEKKDDLDTAAGHHGYGGYGGGYGGYGGGYGGYGGGYGHGGYGYRPHYSFGYGFHAHGYPRHYGHGHGYGYG